MRINQDMYFYVFYCCDGIIYDRIQQTNVDTFTFQVFSYKTSINYV
jgi:hypothetical protein